MPSPRDIRAGAAYIELYTRDSRLVRGLARAQRRLKAFGTYVRRMGIELAAASAAMATPFVAGVKAFGDFERAMANVSTMLDAPEEYMEGFRRAVLDMSVEFGGSTDTLARGLYDILSASIPAGKALGVLEASARAAQAGLTDTGVAADAITTILNAYGLSADHAGEVSDLLFSIVKRGKTTFGELAPSIGMVATSAATAGVSLEELGAALATMTRNGVNTDNAVTALTAIISSFLKPSNEAVKTARSLGFEISAATLASEGLAGVFARITKLPPDAIAKLFPNIRALRGVLPALGNMEGFLGDISVMAERAGATEEAYAKMTGTLSHSLRQLRASAMATLVALGAAVAEPVARAAKALRRFLGYLRTFIENNRAVVLAAAKVIAVIAAVAGALVALGVASSAAALVFGGLSSIITGAATVLSVAVSAIGALLTPVGLVTAAVVALGGYIVYVSGAGAKALWWLGEKFRRLREVGVAAWRGIAGALAAGDIALAARILWLTLKMEWQRGINWLEGKWLGFKQRFLEIAAGAFYGALELFTFAWAGLKAAWVETTAFMAAAWARFTGIVTRSWNTTQGWLAKRWVDLMGLYSAVTAESLEWQKRGGRAGSEILVILDNAFGGWPPDLPPNEMAARGPNFDVLCLPWWMETNGDDWQKALGERLNSYRAVIIKSAENAVLERTPRLTLLRDILFKAHDERGLAIISSCGDLTNRGIDERVSLLPSARSGELYPSFNIYRGLEENGSDLYEERMRALVTGYISILEGAGCATFPRDLPLDVITVRMRDGSWALVGRGSAFKFLE